MSSNENLCNMDSKKKLCNMGSNENVCNMATHENLCSNDGKYLEIEDFEESGDLQAPILIPSKLISHLRKEKHEIKDLHCFAKFDPELFSKKNIIKTFKYICKHATYRYIGMGGKALWYKYHSKLPVSKNYAYIDPKYYDYIPYGGTLEDKNENGKITFSFNNIFIGITDEDKMIRLGIETDMDYTPYFEEKFDTEKLVSQISDLDLDFDEWRNKMEEEELCSKFTQQNNLEEDNIPEESSVTSSQHETLSEEKPAK